MSKIIFFSFLFLFNFHSDFKIIVLISVFIVLIPFLISGLKFHFNKHDKFDCLNFISYFLVEFLNNFYFPV